MGLAREFVRQDWRIVGTVRHAHAPSRLHQLQAESRRQVAVEQPQGTESPPK
jgi:hypothetical protein